MRSRAQLESLELLRSRIVARVQRLHARVALDEDSAKGEAEKLIGTGVDAHGSGIRGS